jgi:hypothetical protein
MPLPTIIEAVEDHISICRAPIDDFHYIVEDFRISDFLRIVGLLL